MLTVGGLGGQGIVTEEGAISMALDVVNPLGAIPNEWFHLTAGRLEPDQLGFR
jgi:hypothetical protein